MSDLIKFNFEGQPITFEFSDGSRMINATEMARPFKGKLVADFLRLKSTKEFIKELERDYSERYGNSHNVEDQILRVVRGGVDPGLQGTWMDEHLSLKFAAWLSPRFEVWVYRKIQELLTQGEASLDVQPGGFAQTLRLLAEQWEKQDKIN